MSGVVGEETSNNVKKVESFLARLRGLSGRVATQMRGDFTTLASINALQDSLKLSNQFRGTIKDTFTLSDSIRKLGGVFGIAHKDFTKFQTSVGQVAAEASVVSNEGVSRRRAFSAQYNDRARHHQGRPRLVRAASWLGKCAEVGDLAYLRPHLRNPSLREVLAVGGLCP
jgi:hypothetical protein